MADAIVNFKQSTEYKCDKLGYLSAPVGKVRTLDEMCLGKKGGKGEVVTVTCHMYWPIEGLGQNLLNKLFLSFISCRLCFAFAHV